MNSRFEEAKVAAQKVMRAALCQSTPITLEIAEAAAERAATKGIEILRLGLDEKLSTIQKIQISECLKNILQARHDVTFANEKASLSEDNKNHWNNVSLVASRRLNDNIAQLGQLLSIEDILDVLI